ncbi:MAG: glycerol kinase GlpK [Raoultibacter sp.]
MARDYIIALDQGTTSSRAVLVDREASIRGMAQRGFEQIYPEPGWVEHDPNEILASQITCLEELLKTQNMDASYIDSIGITNQRETTVVWNRETGKPVYNAIVWQCRRTAEIIEELCSSSEVATRITKTTGLIPDAYFSASKIKWILDNVEGARADAEAGKLCFGTIDSWLIWSLTGGSVHATDLTNASRTMLFDIHSGQWSTWLCNLFGIPNSMLPEVRPSSGDFGELVYPECAKGLRIRSVAGDQQAALFGQCCFEPGEAKNTYGTGCFLLMNTGTKACESKNGLVCTIAASAPCSSQIEYALEGSVFMAGALIQWLRDGLGIIKSSRESELLARSVKDTAGVYVVPAFTGLGAPYWDANARGAVYGLTRGTTSAHIVRAALESLAYQVYDLVSAMEEDAESNIVALNVDGGAAQNDFLMQFQSDILDCVLVRPKNIETTATGAAFLAGLASGFWESTSQIKSFRGVEKEFSPHMQETKRDDLLQDWARAIQRTRSDF